MSSRLGAAALAIALVGCGGGSTLGDPCGPTQPCSNGEVCDLTSPDGPVCISASGDIDGDGLPNDRDFCQHAPGGAYDEDGDGIGDDCDHCPIAAPRETPDPDGDDVDSPCDPDPSEPGDRILLFDGFAAELAPAWTTSPAVGWEVRDDALIASLGTVAEQAYVERIVPASSSLAIETAYRVDGVENSAARHLVGVAAADRRPAGVAAMQCAVVRADTAADVVVIETDASVKAQPTTEPVLLTTKHYRAGAYVTGITAGCSVIAEGSPLGTVQTSITADSLTSIALTARAVSARFDYVLVVGR